MSYFYDKAFDGKYSQPRTGEKARCACCGGSYWKASKFLPVRPWRRHAALRLTCGECGMRTYYAPGTIFTEH